MNLRPGVMPLFYAKGMTSHELAMCKEAIWIDYEEDFDSSNQEEEEGQWSCTVKSYRCILPERRLDERVAPAGDVVVDDDANKSNVLITISWTEERHISEGKIVTKQQRLLSSNNHQLNVTEGDVNELMERAFPDYRLRAECRGSGWTMTTKDGRHCKGGMISLGSSQLGAIVDFPSSPFYDHMFTPVDQLEIPDHLLTFITAFGSNQLLSASPSI